MSFPNGCHISEVEIDRLILEQQDILTRYSSMVKPGGKLVYATCSILPSANRAAVDSLLVRGGFTLLEERPVSPSATGFDGFYAAALVKE